MINNHPKQNRLFSRLCTELVCISSEWHVQFNYGLKTVIFEHFTDVASPSTKRFDRTLTKQVVVEQDFSIKVTVQNHHIQYSPEFIKNLDQFSELLEDVREKKVCFGGSKISVFLKVSCESAKKDGAIWRHKDCEILSKRAVCDSCVVLPNYLRKKHSTSFGRKCVPKRLRFGASSPTKRTIFKKRQHAKNMRLSRKEQQLADAKKELSAVQAQWKNETEKSLEEKINVCKDIRCTLRICIFSLL